MLGSGVQDVSQPSLAWQQVRVIDELEVLKVMSIRVIMPAQGGFCFDLS
ncbi:hypothetical protein OAE97_02870 [Verrucomicrobia bacterium]|jgi:hypothetical protein|nr:hypothetical protein [Verrucomicrobiota bacterium]